MNYHRPNAKLEAERCNYGEEGLSLGMNMMGSIFIFLSTAALLAIIIFVLEKFIRPKPSISNSFTENFKDSVLTVVNAVKTNEKENIQLKNIFREALNNLEKK